MPAKISTPWDAMIEILLLCSNRLWPISSEELAHPSGLRDLSFLAEGYRQGKAAAEWAIQQGYKEPR